MAPVKTRAILLRAHPYSETSQVLRFYSVDLGIVAVLAKGVRRAGGRQGGAPSTFGEGELSLYHKESRDLQTFAEFVCVNARRGLARDPVRFAGAAVLGELVLLHAGSEGNPDLFSTLASGLDALEGEGEANPLPVLLREIWTIIGVLGYSPSVGRCVGCGLELGDDEMGRFDFAEGGVRCPACQTGVQGPRLGPGARLQLSRLLQASLPQDLDRPRTHLRLASDFITYHISGGTPLRSFEVLGSLIPKTDA